MTNAIRTYDFKPGLPAEIELVRISSIFRRHEQNVVQPHRADFYHIFWFTEGTPVHTVDFIPIPIQPHTLLFVNKSRVQFFDPGGNYDGWMLLFTDAFFNQNPQDARFLRNTILFHDLLDIPVVRLDRTATSLTVLFDQLREEFARPEDAVHVPVLRNLLHTLLMLADRERRTQGFSEIRKGPDLDHTLHFNALMEKQFRQVRAVRDYAAQMSLTERRLQQATAAAVGKTPKQLIDDRLVLEAKRLLVHTSLSVKEIGFELGFDEPTNFTRFFRRQIDRTPADFRKQFSSPARFAF